MAQVDLIKDKLLYANLSDPELLILYLDFTQVGADIPRILNQLMHKNLVLRYKFSECLDPEHKKELLKGVAVDIKVNPTRLR